MPGGHRFAANPGPLAGNPISVTKNKTTQRVVLFFALSFSEGLFIPGLICQGFTTCFPVDKDKYVRSPSSSPISI